MMEFCEGKKISVIFIFIYCPVCFFVCKLVCFFLLKACPCKCISTEVEREKREKERKKYIKTNRKE